ncbi:MAG: heme-binding protein [Gammaproteobacteria bacterium]
MRTRVFSIIFILLGNVGPVNGSDLPPTLPLETLSSEIANQMVVASVAECSRRGFLVSAAVVGRDGNLLAFLRNPYSGPHTILVSQRKAFSSATLRARTSDMKSRPDLNYAPGILLIVGGVPIQFNGKFYGGIAVAGARPEVDEICADAGIDAVKEILDFVE